MAWLLFALHPIVKLDAGFDLPMWDADDGIRCV
jgi:hypothetical protein